MATLYGRRLCRLHHRAFDPVSFWLSLIVAPMWSDVLGGVFEKVFLSELYARHDGGAYLMLTFGLAILLAEGVHLIWGPQPRSVAIPDMLRGVVFILNQPFPIYRLFLIGIGGAAAITSLAVSRAHARWAPDSCCLAKRRDGARAWHGRGDGAHRRFHAGLRHSALGGVLSTPLVTAFLGMGSNVIIDAFVIVIIGGMGSFLGSIVGSLFDRFCAGVRRLLFSGYGAGDHLSADADGPDPSPWRPAWLGTIRCANVLSSL